MGLLAEGVRKCSAGSLARQTGSFGATLRRMREWFQRNF